MRRNSVAGHEVANLEVGFGGEPCLVERPTKPQGLGFLDLLVILAKRKGFILKCVCAATLAAMVISLLLPDRYTANTKILSPQISQSMSATLVNQLGLTGIPSSEASDVYLAILRSETIANRLVDRFSLINVYRSDLKVEARRALADRTEINESKDRVISISVNDRSPQRAAELANGYLEELETLNKTLVVSETSK